MNDDILERALGWCLVILTGMLLVMMLVDLVKGLT